MEEKEEDCVKEDATSSKGLSDIQRARIERNRQRALLLRQARASRPYPEPRKKVSNSSTDSLLSGIQDTGAGFFLEPEEEAEFCKEIDYIVEQPPPVLGKQLPECEECGKEFSDSFLLLKYDVPVCSRCKESNEKHKLITRTDAKQHFLLKDCDLDSREPPLKFIMKKNPHNSRWGSMKLYYKPHVVARALEVWGSEEAIEDEKVNRDDKKEKMKQKKFDKHIKDLRRAVRTSTWRKESAKHEHEYDSENETYDSDEDTYSKKCKTCGHVITYEKM